MPGFLKSLGRKERHATEPLGTPLPARYNNTSDFALDTAYHSQDPITRSPVPSDIISSNESASKQGGPQYTRVSGSDLQPPSGRRVDWFTRITMGWWLWEILSMILSFGSLIAIIVVLAKYDDQPLREWSVGGVGLSLNTYLAIFTTLAKAGLVYPIINCIGQLKWIWFSRRDAPLADFVRFDEATRGPWGSLMLLGKGWHLANIGSILSLLAIGISPITQQVIAYPNRLVPGTALAAEVPTSNWWAGASATTIRNNLASAMVSISMQQAINAALWSSATDYISDIQPTCPSGNCTWPEYDSLAVCYEVRDVTSSLRIPAPVTLFGGDYFEYGIYIFNITSSGSMFTDDTNLGPIISSYHIIYETSGTSFSLNATFEALEVLYHWCVNTYSTKVEDGIANTKVVNTSTNWYNRNIPIENPFADNYTLIANGEYYNISYQSLVPLANYMDKLFVGWYDGGAPGDVGGPTSDISYTMYPILSANTTDLITEGVKNYTRNMATSMTNSVRTHLGWQETPNTNDVKGTSYVVETYVRVRWAWLSLLAGLIALGFLFLLATMIKSSISKVEVMKSDALGTLTALGNEAKRYMGPTAMQDGSIEKAKYLRLRLRKQEGGWSLNPVR